MPVESSDLAPAPLPQPRYFFPDVSLAEGEGPAAVGADFAPATIVAAYRAGYFPWPHDAEEYLWFSPDPRAVIPVGGLHVSRRLARTIRAGGFRVTFDTAFAAVLEGCADREEGSWITPAYTAGYVALNDLGWAHSIEVWQGDNLAGGLYGIRVGNMFGAESMFHRVTDASKVAMVALMQWVEREGVTLVDVQVITPHTESMGAVEIPRRQYLVRLQQAVE
ncbi:MAG: leucyl/phenylalanyl-tRNA--protein transferase [Dehalococcoidia bacterium]